MIVTQSKIDHRNLKFDYIEIPIPLISYNKQNNTFFIFMLYSKKKKSWTISLDVSVIIDMN
jgi:hypothetical protein